MKKVSRMQFVELPGNVRVEDRNLDINSLEMDFKPLYVGEIFSGILYGYPKA